MSLLNPKTRFKDFFVFQTSTEGFLSGNLQVQFVWHYLALPLSRRNEGQRSNTPTREGPTKIKLIDSISFKTVDRFIEFSASFYLGGEERGRETQRDLTIFSSQRD
mmetsp:Transcript_43863/g.114384  ORF Transcript_43863/g.114384 Transcript_43863/m.114384 type:complete len:106 (-) Transcript_43863:70-387(-)